MLLERDNSCLLLIDVQEKLTPLVHDSNDLIARCRWLIALANDLGIHTLVSEQYPRGLGKTIPELSGLLPNQHPVEKVDFSCFREPTFQLALKACKKKQMVLIGIETHVCVLQTAIDMHHAGYQVFVVVDAVSSRSTKDYKYALKRMAQAGIQLVTSEMVFFEWVGQAGTEEFKRLSKTYLK